MIGAVVDWDALLQMLWVSLVAGVGVTAFYGVAILGGTRAVDLRRAGRVAEAALFAVLAVAGLFVVVAAIAAGLYMLIEG